MCYLFTEFTYKKIHGFNIFLKFRKINSNHNKKVGTPTNKGSRSRSSFVDENRGNVSSSSGGGNKKGK